MAGACSPAAAQIVYPSKPIRWIVGFTAGGASDVVVRHLGEPMGANPLDSV